MNSYNDLTYEFRARELKRAEAFKKHADHVAKEIKQAVGSDFDVQINVEPEAKQKEIFQVAVSVKGFKEPVVVKKRGKQIISTLGKVRRTVLRKIKKINGKRTWKRKRRGNLNLVPNY